MGELMMNAEMKKRIKKLLLKLIPNSYLKFLYLAYLSRLETWKKKHRGSYLLLNDRFDLYNHLFSKVLHGGPIAYLEFGVYKGETIKYWSTIDANPKSLFFGFDTFSGLPETWLNYEKGSFDTNGEMPDIKDNRISFIKGMFQDVLPPFLEKQKMTSTLVLHMDADLYSSTLNVLTRCNDIILPGTVVIFDEFSALIHEFKALEDYCSAYIRDYVVLGATKNFNQVAIQMK